MGRIPCISSILHGIIFYEFFSFVKGKLSFLSSIVMLQIFLLYEFGRVLQRNLQGLSLFVENGWTKQVNNQYNHK